MPVKPSATPEYPVLLLISCIVVLGCYLGTYMRFPVVPLYATTLGADTVQVGMINAAFLLTAGLLSLPLGLISDRIGIKMLAAAGLLILSASSFLLGLGTTPRQLMWIYLFSGAGLAAFGPTMMSFVANISPPSHLGRSYGWYTMAIYTGMSVGPAMGGFVAQGLGFFMVFMVSGLTVLLTCGIHLLYLPPASIIGIEPAGGRALREKRVTWSLFGNYPLLACWAATLGGCFGLGVFITYLPLHAHAQGLTYGQIGLVFATQGIVNVVSRFPCGHLSDRVKNRRGLVGAGFVGVAAALAIFGVATRPAHFIACAALLGASMGLAFTSVGAMTAEAAPPELRGLAMGGYNTALYLGMMIGAALLGPAMEHLGYRDGFFLTTSITLVVTVGSYFLMRESKMLPAS